MSRKRPAPGTSPVGYQATTSFPNSYQHAGQPLTDEQFLNWGAGAQSSSGYQHAGVYNTGSANYPPQQNAQPSNQLTRRVGSQAVARPVNQSEQWISDQNTAVQQQQNHEGGSNWHDDIEELLVKAQAARKEAQSKRKQIPPFVLKLHSFLDNPKNTDLIRWADDGKSFVVLNEDEFANKLIPELFKHNNYASFVRQLNMYGFHKKVGLSDNSMRASERKAKSPSEYWNPFFRKGYPDLLWLIQKPKNQHAAAKSKARGRSEEGDDEEDVEEAPAEPVRMRPQLTLGPDETGKALTQEQFATLQQELLLIRNQQSQIAQMLGKLKREHDSLVTQANDYQNKHSRHEQSINAILTFLATLYNRSLQNHEGAQAQDIAKIFAQTLNQDSKSGGKVEDYVIDIPEGTNIDGGQSPYKRPRLLLTDGSENRAATLSPSQAASSPRTAPTRRSSHMPRSPQTAHVEEFSDMDFGQLSNDFPSHPGQGQDMMNYIHSTNARNSAKNTPVADFSNVLSDLETSGAMANINDAQRDKLVDIFDTQPEQSRPTTSDGALISPSRSNSRTQFDNTLAASKHGLDQLEQMQGNLSKNIDNMTSFLQPLSPTGSIPGIGDGQDVPPPNFDIDNFLNAGDYFDFNDPSNANLDFSNMNNNAYAANNNGAYGFADDDSLFAGVEDAKDAENSPENGTYGYDESGAGKVESLASSSGAPTPQQQEVDVAEALGPSKRARRS